MTKLDDIIQRAQTDESARQEFYQEFLNTSIFIPTEDMPPDEEKPDELDEGDYFSPVILESEGRLYLPVFDELDKLLAWAKQEISSVQIPAYALLPNIQDEVMLVLNPNTDWTKEFHPEEIEMLVKVVEQAAGGALQTIPQGAECVVEKPDPLPEGMDECIQETLEKHEIVEAAYIAKVQIPSHQEDPTFFILVKFDEGKEDQAKEIFDDVAHALPGILPEDEPINMAVYHEGNGLSDLIVEKIDPSYMR